MIFIFANQFFSDSNSIDFASNLLSLFIDWEEAEPRTYSF